MEQGRILNAGLVLEGGGMKGVYTAGVLDYFMDRGIYFKNIYGVSAGACCLCSYISGQRGRAAYVFTEYLEDKRYAGFGSLFRTGDYFGVTFNYDTVPNRLYPYDYKKAYQYPGNSYAVVTNIRTGEAEYLPLRNLRMDMQAVRASASLPLLSRVVTIGDGKYLDGGIKDAIPICKAQQDGNEKNIVILTKDVSYRRKKAGYRWLIRLRYLFYPQVASIMKERHERYNETLDYLKEQEAAGKVFLLQPQTLFPISRTEKSKERLLAFYRMGYEDAEKRYTAMMQFLEEKQVTGIQK